MHAATVELHRSGENRTIETAQVIEEVIALAKDIKKAGERGESLGLAAILDVERNPGVTLRLSLQNCVAIQRTRGYPRRR